MKTEYVQLEEFVPGFAQFYRLPNAAVFRDHAEMKPPSSTHGAFFRIVVNVATTDSHAQIRFLKFTVIVNSAEIDSCARFFPGLFYAFYDRFS